MEKPLVSLVITTKNESANIESCVKAAKLQSYKNIEVIVVDNGSEDDTKEKAKSLGARVFDKGPERSAQRNYGMIDQSKGEFVMFIDADMILSPGLIETCVRTMEIAPKSVLALHIPEIVLGRGFFSRVRRFERSFYNGTVIDGARFFRKSAFVEVGGFDLNMSGPEDWDIDLKLKEKGKIFLISREKSPSKLSAPWMEVFAEFIKRRGVNPQKYDNVIFHNEADFDLSQYLKKKGYYATSFDGYIEKWGKKHPAIKKQFGVGYRFFGVFLEKGKFVRFFLHPFMVFGLYYLRLRVGLKFLFRRKSAAENPYEKK